MKKSVFKLRHHCFLPKSSLISTAKAVEDSLILEETPTALTLTLNQLKHHNALNLTMVEGLRSTLEKWDGKKRVFILKGAAGGPYFCSGGDLRLFKSFPAAIVYSTLFNLDLQISQLRTPLVSLWGGVALGAGLGISVHGKYRVACDKTAVAMPENRIGLFPDNGVCHLFSRLRNRDLGRYLALTGEPLKGRSVFDEGLATHYVSTSERMNNLEADLRSTENVTEVLSHYHERGDTTVPGPPKEVECFSHETIQEICTSLSKVDTAWAHLQLKNLSRCSPTSLEITLRLLKTSASLSLKDCLQLEKRLAVKCFEEGDFKEGIRALFEKDPRPKWKSVDAGRIDSFFSPE